MARARVAGTMMQARIDGRGTLAASVRCGRCNARLGGILGHSVLFETLLRLPEVDVETGLPRYGSTQRARRGKGARRPVWVDPVLGDRPVPKHATLKRHWGHPPLIAYCANCAQRQQVDALD